MRFRLYAVQCSFALMLASIHGLAQGNLPGNQKQAVQGRRAIDAYMSALGPSVPVFQGAEWVSIYQKAKGHPFFEKSTPLKGSMQYQGVLYSGLSMQYDILQGMVLVLPEGDGLRLAIPKEKLERFSLDSTAFVKSSVYAPARGLSDTVFYRVVYQGPTTVLAWHQKYVRDRPGEETSEIFEEKVLYYIRKEMQFIEVVSENQLVGLQGARNKTLRKVFAERHIRFRKNKEEALLIAANFYDQQK